MKLEIGKAYKIISLNGVAKEHGNCLGNVIECIDFDKNCAWFNGLSWEDGIKSDGYIFSREYDGPGTFGEAYYEWLDWVLEEVA